MTLPRAASSSGTRILGERPRLLLRRARLPRSAPISSAARSSPRASAACCAARARTRCAWRRSASRLSPTSSPPMSIAGMMCGLAGFLLANQTEFVSPAYMTWQRSGELIFMVVLGGLGTLHGAIVGAAAFLLLEEFLSRHHRALEDDLRAAADAGGAVRPRRHPGLLPRACAMAEPLLASSGCARPTAASSSPTTSPRRRAGRAARGDRPERRRQDDADPPDLRPRPAGSGRILFDGEDITRLPMHERVRRGLARSFQITSILPRLLGAGERRACRAGALRIELPLLRRRRREAALNGPALSSSTRRPRARARISRRASCRMARSAQLELAIALATEPKLLLLDEPLAGTGHEESERVVATLRAAQGPLHQSC